jgi:hypothetical protein
VEVLVEVPVEVVAPVPSVSDGGGAVVVTTMFPLHDLDIRRWWFLFVSNMTKIFKTMWHVVGLNVVCQILEVN